mmetsp:Transcript_86614/g.231293  ORF Transcript_86614/g.231293 Transcript_86614/m.231293 type:complete len:307 (+) Transcript_86614:47-967(+)
MQYYTEIPWETCFQDQSNPMPTCVYSPEDPEIIVDESDSYSYECSACVSVSSADLFTEENIFVPVGKEFNEFLISETVQEIIQPDHGEFRKSSQIAEYLSPSCVSIEPANVVVLANIKQEIIVESVPEATPVRAIVQVSYKKRPAADESDDEVQSDSKMAGSTTTMKPDSSSCADILTKRSRYQTRHCDARKAAAASSSHRCRPSCEEEASSGRDEGDGDVVILEECKFLSKRSGFRCPCLPAITNHKRGHLSVCCKNGHQWVWCRACCSCGGGAERRGCRQKAHWFERDAFDTGRRNHMRTAHGK